MQRLDAIEKNMITNKPIEELDKNFIIISLNLGHG